MDDQAKKNLPIVAAVLIAVVVVGIYFFSGRASLDASSRDLQNNETIEEVSTQDDQTITVTCKNGEKYQIIFTADQSNYNDLIFNACRSAGGVAEE